ncbi:MAG: hypothetical protein LBC09_06370 [Helicobacteraceae bacterium]|jgi:acetyltransferase-like isoleucine patch superfamily enzyme|nr:hypothetical protein [Helicobacteraceae bacterium]
MNYAIIGAGGFAIELYGYIMEKRRFGADIEFAGFCANCDRAESLDKYGLARLYLGNYETIELSSDLAFLIAIGQPRVRKTVYESFKALGRTMPNFTAHGCRVNETALERAEGNIFCPGSGGYFYKIGDGNLFNLYTALAHDTEIGSFNALSSYCDITGHCKMGDFNFFGSRAAMLPSAEIGDGNKISAGSVVYKGCKDNTIMHGNPARSVGFAE